MTTLACPPPPMTMISFIPRGIVSRPLPIQVPCEHGGKSSRFRAPQPGYVAYTRSQGLTLQHIVTRHQNNLANLRIVRKRAELSMNIVFE